MEFKTSPEAKSIVIVTVENNSEDHTLICGHPGLLVEDIRFKRRDERYPYEAKVPREILGRVAARAMVSRREDKLHTAGEILEYFESEVIVTAQPH
jgi:hypothetical protein